MTLCCPKCMALTTTAAPAARRRSLLQFGPILTQLTTAIEHRATPLLTADKEDNGNLVDNGLSSALEVHDLSKS